MLTCLLFHCQGFTDWTTVKIWLHSCSAGDLYTPALPAWQHYHLYFCVQLQICKPTHASGFKCQRVKLRTMAASAHVYLIALLKVQRLLKEQSKQRLGNCGRLSFAKCKGSKCPASRCSWRNNTCWELAAIFVVRVLFKSKQHYYACVHLPLLPPSTHKTAKQRQDSVANTIQGDTKVTEHCSCFLHEVPSIKYHTSIIHTEQTIHFQFNWVDRGSSSGVCGSTEGHKKPPVQPWAKNQPPTPRRMQLPTKAPSTYFTTLNYYQWWAALLKYKSM